MKQGYAAALAIVGMIWLAPAQAQDCRFSTVGDPRNGMTFIAMQTHRDVGIASGLGQLRKVARDQEFEVGHDDIKAGEGSLLLVQTTNNPPVVVMASGKANGEFGLVMDLARGQQITNDAARDHMCGMLREIVPGAAGEAIARAARAADNADAATEAEAVALSQSLGREARRLGSAASAPSLKDALIGNTRDGRAHRDVDAMLMPFFARHMGRRYRIDGQVYTTNVSSITGEMTLVYLVTPTGGLLRVRKGDYMNNTYFAIQCKLPADQAPLFATLGSHDWVTLEGVVDEITLSGMVLRDCRQPV